MVSPIEYTAIKAATIAITNIAIAVSSLPTKNRCPPSPPKKIHMSKVVTKSLSLGSEFEGALSW